MTNLPRTVKEAKARTYGVWPGGPGGWAWNRSRCAYEINVGKPWRGDQCKRKPKHGPAKLYCKQHAKKATQYFKKHDTGMW